MTQAEAKTDEVLVDRVALAIAKEIGWGTFSHFNPGDMRRISRAAIAEIMGRSDPSPLSQEYRI